MQLYKITDEFKEVQKALEEGEIDQETFNDTIEAIEMDVEEKFDNISKTRSQLEAECAGVQSEIDRLAKIVKSKKSAINSIDSYCFNQLKKIGKDKISTSIGVVKIAKGRKSVSCDVDKLNDEDWKKFVNAKTTYTPDKKALKVALEELKEGEEIAGACFVVGEDKIKFT